MFRLATSVAFPGPPAVMTYTVSNTWNEPMTPVTRTNSSVGRSSGSVTRRNCSHLVAPSMDAASYKLGGIALRPARKNSMLYPAYCQMLTNAITGIAVATLDSQAGPVIPIWADQPDHDAVHAVAADRGGAAALPGARGRAGRRPQRGHPQPGGRPHRRRVRA